jgi:hypothetical protein
MTLPDYLEPAQAAVLQLRHIGSAADTQFPSRRALVIVAIALSAVALGIECYRYLVLGAYWDHIECNILISGWQYVHGAPLYELQDGAPVRANLYGPLAYLVQMPALLLFGAGVVASKVTSLLALMATVAVMGVHLIRRSTTGQALGGFFLLTAGLLLFGPVSFWVRADPFEVLLVAVAVVLTASRRGSICVGVCIGLAVNFKVHAFVYFLPILVDLWWTGGWRALLTAAMFSGMTFFVPFLMPGISLHDYFVTVSQQVDGGIPSSSLMVKIVIYTVALSPLLVLPLLARHRLVRYRVYACIVLATLALLAYPASIQGAGPHHFLPLLPALIEARRRLQPEGIGAEFAPFLIVLVASFAMQGTLHYMASKRGWDLVSEEALALARHSPVQPVHIGYGENPKSYEISELSKTVLAFNSYPVLLGAQILMELRESGIEGSTKWIPYLTECRIKRWLLPKGEKPFATISYYDRGQLFNEEFRQAFFRHYKLVETTEHFDLWDCAHERQ